MTPLFPVGSILSLQVRNSVLSCPVLSLKWWSLTVFVPGTGQYFQGASIKLWRINATKEHHENCYFLNKIINVSIVSHGWL